MIYYSDDDKAQMAIENEARFVGVISALLIFIVGYATLLKVFAYPVAGWIIPLSLAGIATCWFQLNELRKRMERHVDATRRRS